MERKPSIGKRMLVFSPSDPRASRLVTETNDWGCVVSACATADELRGRIEGGAFDMVLVEGSEVLRRLVADAEPGGEVLKTPLAEIEKRHILRVLASTGGNKTRAARTLGIDTKTLYNKLKAYNASAEAKRRGAAGAGA